MRFQIESRFNDGKTEAPLFIVEVNHVDDLADDILNDMVNDYGVPFGPGHTVTITRLED